jgi:tripartite-type tricarboxylate transporter receptor subunit TctC
MVLFTRSVFSRDAAHYPNRPIRTIVPFAPGGGLDISTRLIGHKLTEKWVQNVVVDSRPGVATIVGTEIASMAAPDGYTLLMITTTFAINPGPTAGIFRVPENRDAEVEQGYPGRGHQTRAMKLINAKGKHQ